MITELAPTKTMNNLIIEFKVDLTQDHDVLGQNTKRKEKK